uniref:Indoleamine 2,3-dioxygenase 2-like n=1 Tax=Seriola lalandi dorsalis TaxID=1841481 RepID=A0A3B4Y3H2_SERLL
AENMETINRETLQADFDAFDISEEFGFLLEEPLTNLPDNYRVWMDLANNLTHLIKSRKLRDLVHEMPVLIPNLLSDHRELSLAHLALGFISMGYVWQEGQHAPAQVLPKALAVPYWLVSRRLGLPPILTYADSVLANWKLRDPTGDMEIGNMDLIFSFPGGESCRGFFIVSLLVEMAASSGIFKLNLSPSEFNQFTCCAFYESREIGITEFVLFPDHVDPTAFHGTLRIFVSGWRDNPMLPNGLLYEGVSTEPMFLSGGSAAQSSAIQCFDALLSIQHDDETGKDAFPSTSDPQKMFPGKAVIYLFFLKVFFLDYMPPAHCQLIETLSARPSLRDLILSCSSSDLCQAYNSCVSAMVDLRSYHLFAVQKYIVGPGNRTMGCPLRGVGTMLNDKGTGGSNLMGFLKGVCNTTKKALISDRPCVPRENTMSFML